MRQAVQPDSQRPGPGFVARFVVASAVVGPLVFQPPLWDAYRRWQVAGFAIGMAAWITGWAALGWMLL